MKAWHAFVAVGGLAVAVQARDASACGGCFVAESEATQVTGHRMILSVSSSQTTLYDQIKYSGNPASFAWVLPIKGVATIGLSSDALFDNLDADTGVVVNAPVIDCSACGVGCTSDGDCIAGGTCDMATGVCMDPAGSVTVVAQQVVGPYETVQLQSSNPSALTDWLTSHGYAIPSDIAPVIGAYVNEAFDFVALKLVPGQSVSAMKPVRITTPGASPTLPLRMVAAGTGSLTPISLWVVGEGRYQPSNMPSFQVDASQVVWNWDTQSSNYATLKAAGFSATGNKGWCVEFAQPFSEYALEYQLKALMATQPDQSGYADATGQNALQNMQDDMKVLFAGMSASALWVTRLEGELSRAALAGDLQIGASADQSQVQNKLDVTHTVGTAPRCGCDAAGGGGASSSGASGGGTPGTSSSCAMTGEPGGERLLLGGLAAFLALGMAARRRVRNRA